ncbi:DUF3995 domain-containing protein [Deinococcus ruber]|uniref:DUF3995 domain-containing protein n=1 Tax=Deinococcus ruber TaxID=1848197 RepID=A0A918FG47_9DEIO|nr:DUF3995 domain-containing protein [Deinococcus ruber]GGR35728.1 hypothetical protein GCM10008957_52000 [Deinococcus ruber]
MGNLPAETVALALGLIAGLHVYWGVGGVWPGRDAQSLARTVVGGPPGMKPPPLLACVAVAGLLLVAAGLLLMTGGVWATWLPTWLLRLGTAGVAAVLLLRGVAGYFMQRIRPAPAGTPFVRLNLLIYSPLCLLLGGLTVWALLG